MGKMTDNYNRLLKSEIPLSETPPIPIELSLELHTGCNHACLFCPNRKQTAIAAKMSLTKAESWLAEAYSLGCKRLGLYAKGEPFVVPNLEEYIALAHNCGYRDIFLTSNGALIGVNRLEKAVKAGLSSIKFSVNAYGSETYKLVHGKDDWDKVVDALKWAISLRKSQGLKVFLSHVETNLDPDAPKRLRDRFGPDVDEIVIYGCSNFCGYLDNSMISTGPDEKKVPCNLPFNKLHITPCGFLAACCGDYQDYLAVADLNNMSIVEAWHSPLFKKLRRCHMDGKLEGLICKTCLYGGKNEHRPLNPELARQVDDPFWSESDIPKLIDKRRNHSKVK